MTAQAAAFPPILNFPRAEAVRRTARRKPSLLSRRTKSVLSVRKAKAVPAVRTSQILREILTKNPTVKNFTVKQIVESIGDTAFGTSLMFFSIPGMLPIPGISTLVVIPTGTIAGQMIAGKKQIRLPKFILKRTVPRRSLAVAIHTILPILEKAEKVAKPRWQWASHPAAQRLLGLFIFVLALAIAFPIPGFNVPQAISIFIIALGLIEKDGLTILIGVIAGLASLVLLGGVVMGIFSFFGFRA
jgi:hypothetical protein